MMPPTRASFLADDALRENPAAAPYVSAMRSVPETLNATDEVPEPLNIIHCRQCAAYQTWAGVRLKMKTRESVQARLKQGTVAIARCTSKIGGKFPGSKRDPASKQAWNREC